VGSGRPGEEPPIAHAPHFDIDEDCLPIGAAALAGVAVRFLSAAEEAG
jgi:metal-dependent amidase/aminoacylase/carboxypeptidase family protein